MICTMQNASSAVAPIGTPEVQAPHQNQSGSGKCTWANEVFSIALPAESQKPDDCLWLWIENGLFFYLDGYFRLDRQGPTIGWDCSQEVIKDAASRIYACIQDMDYQQMERLSGSFLLLFISLCDSRLTVITDRMASRRVFHCSTKDREVIADDIRNVLSFPNVSRDLDARSVVEFLRFNMVLEERTLYDGISTVPPATVLTIRREGVTSERYWALAYPESSERPDDYYVDRIVWAFQESVAAMFNDPDGVGLMLSAGLDSRAIAATLLSQDELVTAVTFGGYENEEVLLAKKIAGRAGFPFSFLRRNPNYYSDIFPDAVHISNGLYSFYHAHMVGVLDQVASHHLHTLIHGWGLDVPFSGSYLPKRQRGYLPQRTFRSIWPETLESSEEVVARFYDNLALPLDELSAQLVGRKIRDLWQSWPREVVRHLGSQAKRHASDYYNQYDYIMLHNFTKFRSYLYPLSVRRGVRERCPLYHNEVLEVALELPPRLRFCSRAYAKAIHRMAPSIARFPYNRIGVSILLPEPIQELSQFLLPTVRRMRQQVSRYRNRHTEYPYEAHHSYPDIKTLMRQPMMRSQLAGALSEGPLYDLQLVNKSTVTDLMAAHMDGSGDYGEYLCALMTLNHWLETNG